MTKRNAGDSTLRITDRFMRRNRAKLITFTKQPDPSWEEIISGKEERDE